MTANSELPVVAYMYEMDANNYKADKFTDAPPESMPQLTLEAKAVHALVRLADARAAIEQAAGAVPEGWKLVPVEPTALMSSMGEPFTGATLSDGPAFVGNIYRAMLAASPAPPKQQLCVSQNVKSDPQTVLTRTDEPQQPDSVHLGGGECGGVKVPPPHALRLKVCLLDGHDPFVFHVDGMMTARVLSGIDDELTANKDDIFKDGQGDYEFTAIHFNGQYGFEGRCELAPGWEFEQIGFVSLDKTLDALDAPTSRPSAPTGQINPDSADLIAAANFIGGVDEHNILSNAEVVRITGTLRRLADQTKEGPTDV